MLFTLLLVDLSHFNSHLCLLCDGNFFRSLSNLHVEAKPSQSGRGKHVETPIEKDRGEWDGRNKSILIGVFLPDINTLTDTYGTRTHRLARWKIARDIPLATFNSKTIVHINLPVRRSIVRTAVVSSFHSTNRIFFYGQLLVCCGRVLRTFEEKTK